MSHLPFLSFFALAACLPAQFFQTASGTTPANAPENMVFDTRRDRVVALVGTNTYEHDGNGWQQTVTANAPSGRYEYAMCFDGVRVLLYGGQLDAGGVGADLWAFDGFDWTLVPSGQGPGPRRAAAMSWDAARNRVVLYGGTDMQGNFPTDTWEWDGANWTVSNPTSPGSRVWHRMVYDQVRQRTVLCGGAFNPIVYADTWEYDGTSWVQTVFADYPPTMLAGLVYDTSTQRVLAFGGQPNLGPLWREEVWAYDAGGGTWDLVMTTPQLQLSLGAAYDPSRQRTVVLAGDPLFGGIVGNYYYRDQGAQSASFTTAGTGCAGAGGVTPSLVAAPGSTPALGSTLTMECSPIGPTATPLLVVGLSGLTWGNVSLPLDLFPVGMPGCPLRVRPDVVMAMLPGGGSATLTWALPNLPALAGSAFFAQTIVVDPASPNGVGSVSNGALGVLQ